MKMNMDMKEREIAAVVRLYYGIFGESLKKFTVSDCLVDVSDEDLDKIDRAIGTLTERERKVLSMHYGYRANGGEPTAISDVAKELNVKVERIRIIERDAFRKLRELNRRDPLPQIFSQPDSLKEEMSMIARELRELHKNPIFRREAWLENKLCGLNALPFVSSDINKLGLSARAYNCLKRAGVVTIAELCSLKEAELYKIPLLGKKAAGEVIEKMSQSGLSLSD